MHGAKGLLNDKHDDKGSFCSAVSPRCIRIYLCHFFFYFMGAIMTMGPDYGSCTGLIGLEYYVLLVSGTDRGF